MAKRLSEVLSQYDCAMDPGEFRNLIVELYIGIGPAYSVDQFLCRPNECAIPLVTLARQRTLAPKLPEWVCLEELMNARKSGDVDACLARR